MCCCLVYEFTFVLKMLISFMVCLLASFIVYSKRCSRELVFHAPSLFCKK
nr:MAG TPA: hypothetical protein [Caudoviricetes sp.]